MDEKSIGFNARSFPKKKKRMWASCCKKALPQDFMKFGLIPEFVGRVPVTVSLDLLDKDAMVRILTEPKNSLVKQYQKAV